MAKWVVDPPAKKKSLGGMTTTQKPSEREEDLRVMKAFDNTDR